MKDFLKLSRKWSYKTHNIIVSIVLVHQLPTEFIIRRIPGKIRR